jgi:hypothetical protein
MAIVFPASPSVNETFTAGSITYKWDGAKWIGLGVTPADRLIEGSNSLEIDASNNLSWTGNNVQLGPTTATSKLTLSSTTTGTFDALNIASGLTSASGYQVGISSAGNVFHWNTTNSSLVFATNNDERFRIDADGRLTKGWEDTAFSGTGQSSDIAIAGTSSNNGLQVVRYNTSFGAYGLTIGRSKNGTIGTHGQVLSGNDIGFVSFVASDGTNWRGCADIAANADGNITSTSAEGKLIFKTTKSGSTTPTQAMTIKANHNVEIHDGNLVFETAGTGIDFSATANSSGTMTSELLADYEEGTFTPTIDVTGTSGTLSISYSNQVGRYVKVGRIVHFTIDIRLSSWSRGTGTGGIMVVGLPFAPVDSGNFSRATGFCNLYNWDYSADSADIPIWSVYQDNGHPWVNISKHREGNTNIDISDPANSSMIFFSGTYEAEA